MKRFYRVITKPIALLMVGVIKLYRICISPLFPSCCRFIPTCSEYGLIAIKRFGAIKGGWLTIKRIARCRPGGGYGYDPVPQIDSNEEQRQ